MRRFILSLLLILALAAPASAANYYFDLASGNDSTGDGTAGNPWKTIDKCTTSRADGDECRGAKTTITTLSGTLTFTNGSTSVATSVDQTGTVAAGDIVGKNSGLEGWWEVASLNATTITLTYAYWGLSGSGSAVTGYKITPVTASEAYDINDSNITISGGWDLTGGPTQDGITCFENTSYASAGITSSLKSDNSISKFIIVTNSGYIGVYALSSDRTSISDIWVVSNSTGASFSWGNSEYCQLTNCVTTGGAGIGFSVGDMSKMTNCYTYSIGTATGDYSFSFGSGGGASLLTNCRCYNSYTGVYFNASFGNFFVDFISDTTRGGSNIIIGSAWENRFYNATISGATGVNSYAVTSGNSYIGNNYFIESTLTDGASGLIWISPSFFVPSSPGVIYKPIGGDSVMYSSVGTIEHDSSAACRSGKCLMYSPSSSGSADKWPLVYHIGSVKIASTASPITLSAYLKDDVSFNGTYVTYRVVRNAKWISDTLKTPTTSWVKESVVVGTGDLVLGEYLDLWVMVTGTAGSVYIDDFSAAQ